MEGLKLFRETDDYSYFLEKLKPKIIKYPASIFAYCLMPNHFHFMIRQNSEKPIYRIFNDLNNSYVQHYNIKYKRTGHLYQGDLQHKLITNDQYLISLCQYIHLNPVKAKLTQNPEDWSFSNYLDWLGKRDNGLFDDELLKEYFEDSNDYIKQTNDYEKYINEKNFYELLLDT